ncbi:hypothetical protein ACFVGN_38110 [Streptomyces sp. NPDC057757]|uniref:hypothetical protein n=1 Tax=Streptomyces sp. NPDC057757 TaxID=3346241 RepID=UPI0036BCA079
MGDSMVAVAPGAGDSVAVAPDPRVQDARPSAAEPPTQIAPSYTGPPVRPTTRPPAMAPP